MNDEPIAPFFAFEIPNSSPSSGKTEKTAWRSA
jgi:hypothetical protein